MANKPMVQVETSGEDKLSRRLEKIRKKSRRNLVRKATKKGAEVVKEGAEERAPERSGRLKRNIETEHTQDDVGEQSFDIGPNEEAWYGIFPEIGTEDQPAQPYLRPSMDEGFNDIVDKFGEVMREGILKEIV